MTKEQAQLATGLIYSGMLNNEPFKGGITFCLDGFTFYTFKYGDEEITFTPEEIWNALKGE